ncbi:MAG: putative divalent heavy-metal cations transporter [Candidatus Methanohalarchaeum thermophilum]|uniref:Divalent heavy-metal cations transporter n=1 Tax=Methanohalarchaeum thermophilum TaxID=1903181 RepID=A0A1Q6DTE0_METT1|nr:MAG: putative divalent heavy-metal cations transporter [Candidatus Methanohalarchaeum thermophilum]
MFFLSGGDNIFEFSTFGWIAIFAVVSAVVNGFGIIGIMANRELAEKYKTYFMCFAAGILISTPLILALPKAVESNSDAGFISLIGFLFMFFSNKLIKYLTKERELAFGVTAAEGIGIHSFVDGITYTVTFNVSILLGFLSGTGLVIHEFAEGIITYLFLIKGGVKKQIAGIYAFIIAGLTTPLGAFVVYPVVSILDESTLGLLLGFVSGVLIYVSAAHLLPEAQEHEAPHSMLAFSGGVVLALFIVFTKII